MGKEYYLAKNFYFEDGTRIPQVKMRLDSKDCFENRAHWFQRCITCDNYYCTDCQTEDDDRCNSCYAKLGDID